MRLKRGRFLKGVLLIILKKFTKQKNTSILPIIVSIVRRSKTMKKEIIRKVWVAIQWWIGDRLWDVGIVHRIFWGYDKPWTVYYYLN